MQFGLCHPQNSSSSLSGSSWHSKAHSVCCMTVHETAIQLHLVHSDTGVDTVRQMVLYLWSWSHERELLCFSVFFDPKMLLQYRIVMLNDIKASHNEIHAFGSEPWHAVSVGSACYVSGGLFKILLYWRQCMPDFPVWACLGMPASCTKSCARPLLWSAQTLLCSALCFTDYCQHFVRYESNKMFWFFWGVGVGWIKES